MNPDVRSIRGWDRGKVMVRFKLAVLGLVGIAGTLFAQFPPPSQGQQPVQAPAPPQFLPTGILPSQAPENNLTPGDPTVQLPLKESFFKLDPVTISVRRQNESWMLYAGPLALRDLGNRPSDAEDMLAMFRALKPTEWAIIGTPRAVVEYGLTNGKPFAVMGTMKLSQPLDLKSVRVENVRGAWVVRDDENIHLNCGSTRADAEQAAGVCRKYGFNRIGYVGHPQPVMAYLYAAPVSTAPAKPNAAIAAVAASAQEQNLGRTGIPVPGLGFVGERLVIDARKVEVRKDRGDWVLAHGPDVLTRFGASEWSARDALKVVQDCRFTEFCRFGTAGVTFFLINGQAPTKVPFSVQGSKFANATLTVRPMEGKYGVFEGGGRMLFPAGTKEEGEQLVKLLQMFQFDQFCQVGLSPRASLKFLAKSGR